MSTAVHGLLHAGSCRALPARYTRNTRNTRHKRTSTFIPAMLLGLAAFFGVSTSHSAPLPELEFLPVAVIADSLLNAGGGGKYEVSAYAAGGMQTIGKDLVQLSLKSPLVPHPMMGRTRFFMRVAATQNPPSYVSLNITSTNKPCLVTSIDAVLDQAYQPGRTIEITPVLVVSSTARMPRRSNMYSICTAESGQLTIYFPTPALDMMRMVIISHSSTGRRMAASSLLSELPMDY